MVKGAPRTADSLLSLVLKKYFDEHSDFTRTKKMARHAGALVLEKCGAMIRAAQLDEAKQKEFITWGIDEQNWSIGYICRIMGVVAAAYAHCKVAGDILTNEDAILSKWPHLRPKPKRQVYEPTDEELARLLAKKIPEDLRRFIMNSMATAGRPEAVMEFRPAQRKKDQGLLDLNPDGRRQNKKYRAIVRELSSQTAWLDRWEEKGLADHGGRYCLYDAADTVNSAFRTVADKKAGIPRLSSYSIRHRATSVLRASKSPWVPGEQISYQLGHKRMVKDGEAPTTRFYGQFPPNYLDEAAQVLEAWIAGVLARVETIKRGDLEEKAA